jgi:hypothetical protein
MRTLLSSRRIFTVWYWFAAPLMVGASVIAFATNIFIGVAWSLLFSVWFWHSGKTNCSRCAYYGTLNCGVQGKIMAMLWQRQPMASASPVNTTGNKEPSDPPRDLSHEATRQRLISYRPSSSHTVISERPRLPQA